MSEGWFWTLVIAGIVALIVTLSTLLTLAADVSEVTRIDNRCLFVVDENNHVFGADSRVRGVYCPSK